MNKLISINPTNNQVIGEVEITTQSEIATKVEKARKAFVGWSNLPIYDRVSILQKVYDALYEKRDEISKLATSEMGFPITQQQAYDLGDSFNYMQWYLENAEKYLQPEITFENEAEIHRVYHEPYGVAGVIQPWNFPLCQWTWSVFPNLIVGNTVVFKHSEEVPLTGQLIEKIVNSVLPEGVFNEVYGDGIVGEILTDQNIDLICFTGSCKVGKVIYQKSAPKMIRVLLELGGSAPGIIRQDADLGSAIEQIFALRFTNCGQACDGLKRLFVHESIFDQVVTMLTERLQRVHIGNPTDPQTEIGPLATKRQQRVISGQVDDAIANGAKVVVGGKIPNIEGAYFEPTLLINVNPTMRVFNEEVFGPVLPIIKYSSDEEVIELANQTRYGLGGYVFSGSIETAQQVAHQLKTGMVSINGVNYVCPFNPFGGYKESGIGRLHGRFGLLELTQVKVIASPK